MGHPHEAGASRRQFLSGLATGVLAWTLPVGTATSKPSSALATAFVPTRNAVADFDSATATSWFELALRLTRDTPGFSPPVASRAFGYLGMALYEALVAGMPDHRSLAGVMTGLSGLPLKGRDAAYHWPSVASRVLAATTQAMFSHAPAELQAEVCALEHDWQRRFAGTVPPGLRRRSIERADAVARAIYGWSTGDGGADGDTRNFPGEYIPPVGPGLWEPTPPAFQRALQPSWGNNRCFAVPGPDLGHQGPPTPFSTDVGSQFYTEAVEVYDTVNALDDQRLEIAHFWADDPGRTATPPGHWVSILSRLLRSSDSSLAVAAEAYARLGMAVADSFIACWWVKFRHNLLRPITFIRAHVDPAWGEPLPVTTPPFPEYTSGHSVQSAAAATVLTSVFGHVDFVDLTHDRLGLPARRFDSFDDAANEAAISRLYGGIHFRPAIERGLTQGRVIGDWINALPWRG